MFTGLIETVGKVENIKSRAGNKIFTINAGNIFVFYGFPADYYLAGGVKANADTFFGIQFYQRIQDKQILKGHDMIQHQ